MKKILKVTFLLFTLVTVAFARYHAYKGENSDGFYRYCYYTDGYTITVQGNQLCPLSIDE